MIGEKIAIYREEKNMSQEDLAKALDVSVDNIISWEAEQVDPPVSILLKLSEIFNVSIDELCGNKRPGGKRDYITTAETIYDKDILTKAYYYQSRKHFIAGAIGILIFAIAIITIIIDDNDALYYLIMPNLFIVIFAISIISNIVKIRKRVAATVAQNNHATYHFYQDHVECIVTSSNGTSNYNYRYDQTEKKDIFKHYIYLNFENRFIFVDLNKIDAKDQLLKALDLDEIVTRPVTKGNGLLVLMFMLSVVSIFLALMLNPIIYHFSKYPRLTEAYGEYLWSFYLLLPIPLASIIIGIIYSRKMKKEQYKMSVANIVVGVIVFIMMFGFGSISFEAKKAISHDFAYMEAVDRMVPIEFPDEGIITVSYGGSSNVQSTAKVIFKGEETKAFNLSVPSDDKWKTSISLLPEGILIEYYTVQISGYDYYCLFDVTDGVYNKISDEQENHQYIFLSYSPDESELFIIVFQK